MSKAFWHEFVSAVILSVSGRDAERYLHARLSNDIKALKDGAGCLAACLTAQGRTEGVFAVYRLSKEEFLITCDGGEKDLIVSAFRRFIVADRVKVEDLSAQKTLTHILIDQNEANAFFETELQLKNPFSHVTSNLGLCALRKRIDRFGFDLISTIEEKTALVSKLKDISASEIIQPDYLVERLKAAQPSFPEEINSETLFLESGLKSAVSFTKGCYVGQEVMERVDSMGRAPRQLWSAEVEGSSLSASSDILTLTGEKAGSVINSAFDSKSGKLFAFVYIRNKDYGADPGFSSDGKKIVLKTLVNG